MRLPRHRPRSTASERLGIPRLIAVLLATPLIAVGFVGVTASPAFAADHPVNDSASLITAVTDAVDGDTITFTSDITLAAHVPLVTADIGIVGAGHALDVDGHVGFTFQNASAGISDLTIENAVGAGISGVNSSLDISGVTVSGSGGEGLRVVNDDGAGQVVTIADSHFLGNSAEGIRGESYDGASIAISDTIAADNGTGISLHLEQATGAITGVTASNSTTRGVGVILDDAVLDIADLVTDANSFDGLNISAGGAGTVVTIEGADAAHNRNPGFFFTVFDGAVLDATGLVGESNGQEGLFVVLQNDGAATIADSRFEGNDETGAEFDAVADGVLTLTRVESVANHTGIAGVARSGSLVTVEDSSVFGNTVGIELGLGIVPFEEAEVRIQRSTVNDNEAAIEAVLGEAAQFSLVNSTVSTHINPDTAAILVDGEDSALFALRHATVTGNIVPETVLVDGVETIVAHTIVGGNTVPGGDLVVGNPDDLTVEYSLVENLVDPASQAAVDAGPGNLIGDDPLLGPLADNGGFTHTHLPLVASPVLDAGDPAIAGAPPTDQRGADRIQGAAIDIGAVEEPVGDEGEDTPGDTSGEDPDTLSDSGADAGGLLLAAAALLAFGTALLSARRLRRRGCGS